MAFSLQPLVLSLLTQPLASSLQPISWDRGEVIFLKLLIIFGLVFLNALFVASEFAIVKIRPAKSRL